MLELREEWQRLLLPSRGSARAESRESAALAADAEVPDVPPLFFGACYGSEVAQELLRRELASTIANEDLHELWVLLGQIAFCVEQLADPTVVRPWWVLHSQQAGSSGVAEQVDLVAQEEPGGADAPLDVSSSVYSASPPVKLELAAGDASANPAEPTRSVGDEPATAFDANAARAEADEYSDGEGSLNSEDEGPQVRLSCWNQLINLRMEWLERKCWPAEMAHGGNAACVAALERRAKYITFAAAPAPGDDRIGLSGGTYGPDMRLFCWGGGRISLVGIADVHPSEDCSGECLKDDLTIAGDGFNGVELHPTDSTDMRRTCLWRR